MTNTTNMTNIATAINTQRDTSSPRPATGPQNTGPLNSAPQNSGSQHTAPQDSSRILITLLQLGRRARAAQSAAELGFVAVNETLQLISYRQAALWLTTTAGLGLDIGIGGIAAVSGTPQADPNSPYIQWLSQLARSLHKADGKTDDKALRIVNQADLPEHLASDWHNWLPEHLLWLPLVYQQNNEASSNGGLLFARPEPWTETELALASELGQVYQHALQALNPRRHWQFNLREWFKPTRTKAWVSGIALAVCLFPVHLSVLAPAEVIPREPFLVRAPLDGVIENFYVRPNQPVTPETPLFSLDITALQSQHAVAQQAYDTAQEEFRQTAQLAVTDDKSKLEMALRRGALAEKSVELDYSAEQLGRVQVKAERAGVAVFGDINDWQGKAVMLGEKIILLADPNKVEISIDLPATDIIALPVGAEVKLYPNASAISSYSAKVTNIAYRAETTPAGVLAYRIKAELSPEQDLPRLGLMGTAKISGGYVPFSYYLLRKPLTATRQWLGW